MLSPYSHSFTIIKMFSKNKQGLLHPFAKAPKNYPKLYIGMLSYSEETSYKTNTNSKNNCYRNKYLKYF